MVFHQHDDPADLAGHFTRRAADHVAPDGSSSPVDRVELQAAALALAIHAGTQQEPQALDRQPDIEVEQMVARTSSARRPQRSWAGEFQLSKAGGKNARSPQNLRRRMVPY